MEKKYQVFISSTFTDLKDERKKIIEALLMADCIPACMESFVATNAEQFTVIKKCIDLCDIYVLIIARRYGSICSTTGISYTEMEYDYATSKDIPILVFALDDAVTVPPEKTDTDAKNKAKLAAFRTKALSNLASMWVSTGDLVNKMSIAIYKAKDEIVRGGWQRESDDAEYLDSQIKVAEQNLELLKENKRLRANVRALNKRKNELEKELSEERIYLEYEGKWIQYIRGFERPYSVCELIYKEGYYQFNGFNYFMDKNEAVYFKSKVVSNHHIIMKDKSFCYITDASKIDEATQDIRGFGEVGFLDKDATGAHDGIGYFYDVNSAKEKSDKALQEYEMVKHDQYLYKRLGLEETLEAIEAKSYEEIWELVMEHKEACFLTSKKAKSKNN